MASLNKVLLIGNLTRDPELRYIPNGSAVLSFTMAMNRVFKLPTGEKKEETSFVRVVVWGRMGEVCAEYLKKGNPVFVEGRLQSRSWDGPDGQKKNTMEVIATNVQFLRGGQGQGAGRSGADPEAFSQAQASKDEIPDIQLDEMPEMSKGDEVPF